jgi:hypothetical protein
MNFVAGEILIARDPQTGADMQVEFVRYAVVGCIVRIDFGLEVKVQCSYLRRPDK